MKSILAPRTNAAYLQGASAIANGYTHKANPYSEGNFRADWYYGYYDAMTARDLAHVIKKYGPFDRGLPR